MNIGIIGTGKIGTRMAVTLEALADPSLCAYAVAARDYEKTRAFAQKFGVRKAYRSYLDLTSDPNIDLVYIGTPHVDHYEHARAAILAGKAVLCEKPFTVNAVQARELFALAAQKRVFITEAMWVRFLPWRHMVDEMIAEGKIGEPRFVTANLGYDNSAIARILDPALAGGAFLDLSVYTVNFALTVLGTDISAISADAVLSPSGVDLSNSITLKYKNGAMASLASTVLVNTDRHAAVCGTKGWIVADNVIRADHVSLFDLDRREMARYATPKRITGFEYQVRACRSALDQGLLACAEIPHAETVKNLEILDAARAKTGVRFPFEADSVATGDLL